MNFVTAGKLQEMRNAGGAAQRQGRAAKIIDELRDMLLESEWMTVFTAWSHYKNGEGAVELYAVCNALILKYRSGPPTRTSLICL